MLGRAKATRNARGEVSFRVDLHKIQESLRALVYASIPGGGPNEP
jgi:hypothetical protein